MRFPGKLNKYGITRTQYFAETEKGNHWCSFHRRFEPVGDFYRTKEGRFLYCKSSNAALCNQQYQKHKTKRLAYMKAHPPTLEQRSRWNLNRDLQSLYHVSPEWHAAKLKEQNRVCALCGGTDGERRRLAIDHDRRCCNRKGSCGKCVRGLVCSGCNGKLGVLEIVIEESAVKIEAQENTWLHRALAYLLRYQINKETP